MYVLPLGLAALLFVSIRAYYQGLVLAVLAPFVLSENEAMVLIVVATVSNLYGRLRAAAMDGDGR